MFWVSMKKALFSNLFFALCYNPQSYQNYGPEFSKQIVE